MNRLWDATDPKVKGDWPHGKIHEINIRPARLRGPPLDMGSGFFCLAIFIYFTKETQRFIFSPQDRLYVQSSSSPPPPQYYIMVPPLGGLCGHARLLTSWPSDQFEQTNRNALNTKLIKATVKTNQPSGPSPPLMVVVWTTDSTSAGDVMVNRPRFICLIWYPISYLAPYKQPYRANVINPIFQLYGITCCIVRVSQCQLDQSSRALYSRHQC